MNLKNKSTRLKYKTLFYLVSFSVFILLLLWHSNFFISRYLYERFQTNDVEMIIEHIPNVKPEKLNYYLRGIVYSNSVCIEYDKADGESILYNDTIMGCLLGKDNQLIVDYKEKLLKENNDVSSSVFKVKKYKSKALLYKVNVEEGTVFIFTLLTNVNKNYSTISTQLIYITAIVIVISILLSLYLANRMARPILNINSKAKELAKGNYDVGFEHYGIKEVDELSDTLNYMGKEVSKVDEYRRDLMANVSHDLKTPLTMIKAYAEMVRDISYKNKKKREEDLNIIISEVNRLNYLVEDILVSSKLQSSTDELVIETFDLAFEIHEIINKYTYLDKEGYKIILDIPSNIFVKADKKRIDQVIYNLVNNAINYTGDDKKVTIRVTPSKKDYLVEVIDTGKGIKEEELVNIWERYYMNEKNHKRNAVGTGLGLSIVKSILEKHKFDYGVNSVLGQGTTFFFRIKRVNKRK